MIDTSAVLATLNDEPEGRSFNETIEKAEIAYTVNSARPDFIGRLAPFRMEIPSKVWNAAMGACVNDGKVLVLNQQ